MKHITFLLALLFSAQGLAYPFECSWTKKAFIDQQANRVTYVKSLSVSQINQLHSDKSIKAKFGVDVYKMEYQTQFRDKEYLVSGMIAAPRQCGRKFPSILLQKGTTIDEKDAPTYLFEKGLLEASRGFVTIVPDYIGYGSSSEVFPPYLIAESYIYPALDALQLAERWAQWKPNAQTKIHQPLFLKGYSEGAFASLAIQRELEKNHLTKFNLAGNIIGAGPYNLLLMAYQGLNQEEINPALYSFIISSYQKYYTLEWSLQEMITASRAIRFQNLYQGSFSSDMIKLILPKKVDSLLDQNFKAGFLSKLEDFLGGVLENPGPFIAALAQNSVDHSWQPSSPTHFYHCEDDETIPAQSSQLAVQKLGQGSNHVSYELVSSPSSDEIYTHGACPAEWQSIYWIEERLERN